MKKRTGSSHTSTVVDNREPSSTASTTPVLPNSPLTLPANVNQPVEALIYQPPLAPHSHTPGQSPPLPAGLPQTPQRNHLGHLPHVSNAPSSFLTDSVTGIGVPFFLSWQKNLLRPDMFPTSPFATPLKEKAYLKDEDDTFAEVCCVPLPTNEWSFSHSLRPVFCPFYDVHGSSG